MDEIINRLDRIEKYLDKLDKKLDNIENKDENHRQFINDVYDNVRKPFEYIINKVSYFSGNNIELPNRTNNLIEVNNLINDID
jgi:hypothetical protein